MNKTRVVLNAMIAAAVLICATCPQLAHGQASKAKAKVVGLSITLPDPDSEYGQSAVMGRMAGVEVYVQVKDADSFFLNINDDDEPDVKFTAVDKDDEDGEEFEGELGYGSDISDDGTTVTIPFSISQIPPSGTQKLKVQSKVTLVVGSDPKTDDVEFEIKDGVEIKLGGIDVTLTEVESDPFGDGGWMFGFESKESLDSIQEITFVDSDGNEIEGDSMGSSSFGFNDDMTYTKSYMIQGDAKKITAKVSYFGSTSEVEIPVDVSVGLSLDK